MCSYDHRRRAPNPASTGPHARPGCRTAHNSELSRISDFPLPQLVAAIANAATGLKPGAPGLVAIVCCVNPLAAAVRLPAPARDSGALPVPRCCAAGLQMGWCRWRAGVGCGAAR